MDMSDKLIRILGEAKGASPVKGDAAMQYDLRFVKGGCVGRTVLVGENQHIVFGRSRDASIQFQDPMISRHHCELSNSPDGLSVFDLKSWNGTYVNGTRISVPTRLANGDKVAFGKTLFQVQSAPANTDPDRNPKRSFSDGSTRDGWRPDKGWPETRPLAVAKKASVNWDPNMIPDFLIEARIGGGAVGTVYRAKDKRSGRSIALKIVDSIYASSPNGIKRFLRAAQICRELRHPNIMQIYEVGDSNGAYYIVMEHIIGKEVGDIIVRYKRIAVGSALQIAMQLCDALQYAFQRSVIHRDIKPKNIMVSRAGVAKLVDFGLAKRKTNGVVPTLTAPGEAVGTLAYMPPEQLDDALNADHRADTYSLGATLYHMVTGHHPFDETSFAEFVTAIMTKMPDSVCSKVASLPPELDAIIFKAMAKDPADRYQTPQEFGSDLLDLAKTLSCEPIVASPYSDTAKMSTPPEVLRAHRDAMKNGSKVSADHAR